MSIKVVLFDLDGTLLPMDQDIFIKHYFGGIGKKLALRGYEPNKLIEAIWLGTKAMINNDGKYTNEKVFWDTFARIYGEKVRKDEPYFEQFYIEDFDKIKNVCGFAPQAKEVITLTKDLGYNVVLATNPIFPMIATEKRIVWAGLDKSDFSLITTYENTSYCKPNLDYYLEILEKLGVLPEECLMVGNDVNEDMVVKELGMKVFLLTDCLINKNNLDISVFPNGSFVELIDYLKKL